MKSIKEEKIKRADDLISRAKEMKAFNEYLRKQVGNKSNSELNFEDLFRLTINYIDKRVDYFIEETKKLEEEVNGV